MKNPRPSLRTLSAALFVAALTGVLAVAVPSAPAQPPAQPAAQTPAQPSQPRAEGDLSLEGHMKRVNRAFKTLSRQIADPSKNESSLELVQTIETHFVAAKVKVPGLARNAPDAQRADLVKSFRSQTIKAIAAFLELEQQLLSGENAKAAQTLEKIKELQTKGHETFQVDDEGE